MKFHIGVLPDGQLVELWQVNDWNEELGRWERSDVLIDGTPIQTQTFLPFLWGYSTWEQARVALQSGQISNINDMKRKWRVK